MNKVFIIAEAGVNHNGSIELAKKLIDVAVEAKVDAVKFQTFKAENLVSKNAQKADYQKETTNKEESQFEMIKKLELDVDTHKELISYCRSKNIMFLSTPFDHDSIELLNDFSESFREEWTYKLGNFTLLTHNMNSSAKNYDFTQKQKEYEKTILHITKELSSLSSIDEDYIKKRQHKIISAIYKDLGL